tara:strand:- start:5014 stop:5346 length:333 start_codon:yes stop_codon:yes gene_type:complete
MINNEDKIFEDFLLLEKTFNDKLSKKLLTKNNLEFMIHCLNHYLINNKKIKEKNLHKISTFLLQKYISKPQYTFILNNPNIILKAKVYSFNIFTIEHIILNIDAFIEEFS